MHPVLIFLHFHFFSRYNVPETTFSKKLSTCRRILSVRFFLTTEKSLPFFVSVTEYLLFCYFLDSSLGYINTFRVGPLHAASG